jgi:predicted nucleic acid-binding Zn ribbon protein
MNCRFCGTALPEGAQFCAECGRPAPVATAPAAPRTRPVMPAIVFSSDPQPEPVARPIAVADSEFSCPQCGAPIDEDDVFCGECGFVLSSSYLSAPVDAVGDVRETSEPSEADAADGVAPVDDELDAVAPDSGEVSEVSGWVAVAPDPEPFVEPALEPAALPVATAPPKALRAVPDPFPWGKDPRVPTVDLEATRISATPFAEERFVLQFSTGESITVSGAGLVGRNPASQPGEFVDQLVTIFDAGKSVSKTHLEFGQDSGRFWVSDRYSTNGSTVRQPDAEPKRCEPGRRYFIARGTRVDIGDQFFVVS